MSSYSVGPVCQLVHLLINIHGELLLSKPSPSSAVSPRSWPISHATTGEIVGEMTHPINGFSADMVSLPTHDKSPISRYVRWDTDGDACNCFNKRLSVSSCILFEGGKRDGAFYVYRCRHYRHHHSSISFSALTHALRGTQELAVADPTLAQPEGADADPATAATRPAKPPRVLLQMPVNVRSVSLVVLATRPACSCCAGPAPFSFL